MIVCAGRNEGFNFAKSIGVGLVESAMGLAQVCAREIVESVVFIGSAGAYSKDIPLFSLWLSDSASQLELSFLQDQSYTPLDNHIESGTLQIIADSISSPISQGEGFNVSCETLTKRVIVNSSNYITTDALLAARFHAAQIKLENMEFFSVMRVAQEFGLPCFGLFCVSNYCDENAHKDFVAHHSRVKDILISQYPLIESFQAALKPKTPTKII